MIHLTPVPTADIVYIIKCSSNCAHCNWSVRVHYSSIKHASYVMRVLYRVIIHAACVRNEFERELFP